MNPFCNIQDIATLSRFEFESPCRHYTGYVQLDNHIALCRVLTRYKIYVDTRDRSIATHLLLDGFWKPWLTQYLALIVKPGDVCIDVGANFGYYSVLLSALAGSNGRVIAFEPNPVMTRLLPLTASANGFWFETEELALSYKKGRSRLMVSKDFLGNANILEPANRQIGSIGFKVRTDRLDDVLREKQITKVDVIKIAAEGAETWVFEAMQQTILQNPDLHIVMEYRPYLYENARAFTEYLFSRFTVRVLKDVSHPQEIDGSDIEYLLNLCVPADLHLKRKNQ